MNAIKGDIIKLRTKFMNKIIKNILIYAPIFMLIGCISRVNSEVFCLPARDGIIRYTGDKGGEIEFIESKSEAYLFYRLKGQSYPPHMDGVSILQRIEKRTFVIENFVAINSDGKEYSDSQIRCNKHVDEIEKDISSFDCLSKDGREMNFLWSKNRGILRFKVSFGGEDSETYSISGSDSYGIARLCKL